MKKILIVDDESELRNLLQLTLAKHDRLILQAENGEMALVIARATKPDLIIMDVILPGSIDGLEATRILKNDPTTRGCRIIVVSAKYEQGDRKKAFAAGACEHFPKPFSPLDLMRKAEEVLGFEEKENYHEGGSLSERHF